MTHLPGKRLLITGAARGIGKAIAERARAAGASLILTDIDQAELAKTAKALGAPAYGLDVTDAQAVAAVRAQIAKDQVGPIDVLVNNAGTVRGGAFLDVPLEQHLLTYRVNTLGMVVMTHAFLPDLIARPQAHLVNTVSASALVGLPRGSTYASSKWAALGFSESIRLELRVLGHRHVKVTALCPSFVDTKLFDGATPPASTRMLTPEHLAALVVRAIERDQRIVLTPFLVRLTPLLKGVLPAPLFDWVAARFGVYDSMQGWHGPAPAAKQG